jgi:hypothetical protein
MTEITYDQMDAYTACAIAEGFSDSEPTVDEMNAAWQFLIDTGLCWKLQGWYGRNAARLIEDGTCLSPKREDNPHRKGNDGKN